MKAITVLMTGAGAPGARGIIYSLKNNGERDISIVATDLRDKSTIDSDTLNQLSAFYTIPTPNTSEYLEALKEICKKEKVDVLLPINTDELNYLSMNISHFRDIGVEVCVMPIEVLRIANHKTNLLQKMKDAGLRTPAFAAIHTVEDFERAAIAFDYPNKPFYMKRPDSTGSRGMRIIDAKVSAVDSYLYLKPQNMYMSYEEMLKILPEALKQTELLAMEALSGDEYSVDAFVDRGNMIVGVCRRVDQVVGSINIDSTLIQNDAVLSYCREISSLLKMDGVAGFDLKMNDNGEPMILEINPRLQATVILSVAGGINFPYFGIKRVLGEPITIPKITEGLRITQRTQRMVHDSDGNTIIRL